MKVIGCLLYGLTPEEVLSQDLVAFVEEHISLNKSLTMKSVLDGTDPAWNERPFLGFNPYYGIAYLSNPEKKLGITGIDPNRKILVHNPDDEPFFEQRDSFMFDTPLHTYVRGAFPEVLYDFSHSGYKVYEIAESERRFSMTLFKDPLQLPLGKEMSITDLL